MNRIAALAVCATALVAVARIEAQGEEKRLTLEVPSFVPVKQGETTDVMIVASRRGFDDEVKLELKDLPKGVTVEGDLKIPKGQNQVVFKLKAAEDAPPGDRNKVAVTGEGGGVKTRTLTINVAVKKK